MRNLKHTPSCDVSSHVKFISNVMRNTNIRYEKMLAFICLCVQILCNLAICTIFFLLQTFVSGGYQKVSDRMFSIKFCENKLPQKPKVTS